VIFLSFFSYFLFSQETNQVLINGKVIDSSGIPLPGVTVLLKGTGTGTVTDNNGDYSLSNVTKNGILQFSFVGMKTQEIKLGTKSTINVTLVEGTVGLDEIVAFAWIDCKAGKWGARKGCSND
jgi:hypothetical protein